MKTLLKPHILITFVVGYLLFGSAPTAHDFVSSEHHVFRHWRNDLIKRAHDDHWLIGYRYGDDCLPENRPAEKELEEVITKALQVWLQPLRDMEIQPAAIMAFHVFVYTNQHLTQDDKNGMIWLYKVDHEDLDPADCFFPNYKFEADPDGCVPEFPLIFEVRQGHDEFARRVLTDDENIDVNAQDHTGATALHYAISGRHTGLVDALLEHDDIFVHLKDNDGRTPVAVAREAGDNALAERLLAHPNYALNVEPTQKLATKWASLKKDY